jgi:Protein of unknown function (DUF2637)
MTAIRWAAGLTALVALAAGIISYSALAALARAVGVDMALSWLYPLVVDGVLGVGTVAALVLRTAPLRTRGYIWTLITAAIAVSVAGNALHAERGLVLPPVAAAAASAVPAMSLAAALHLLVIIVRGSGVRGRASTQSTVPVEPARPSARVAARGEVRRLLRRQGSALTAERVAERTGVSIPHARRLLREERQPHVVEGQR